MSLGNFELQRSNGLIASPEHESGDGASGFGQQRGGDGVDGDAGAQDGEAAARRSESKDDEHQHETATEVGAIHESSDEEERHLDELDHHWVWLEEVGHGDGADEEEALECVGAYLSDEHYSLYLGPLKSGAQSSIAAVFDRVFTQLR